MPRRIRYQYGGPFPPAIETVTIGQTDPVPQTADALHRHDRDWTVLSVTTNIFNPQDGEPITTYTLELAPAG